MAANAGTKCLRVADNLERLLAIELMCAMQGLYLRRPQRSSAAVEALHEAYRVSVPPLGDDRILHNDLEATLAFMRTYTPI
jgi:histidine ammonia-lyase